MMKAATAAFSHPSKQERRGGIETGPGQQGIIDALGGSRNAVVALKHCERRGDRSRRFRSRNAVVALKPFLGPSGSHAGAGSRNAVVALKHRYPPTRTVSIAEAGTPWWH